jgi:hypothetical protein
MTDVRFLSAQPADNYYAWQTEVFIENFLEIGYSEDKIDVICGITDGVPVNWINLQVKYPDANFYFYHDTREDKTYGPSIRPHLLNKHFRRFDGLVDETFFYHDCDFLFTKYMDFAPFLNDDIWYLSNVRSYIGPEYIESKGIGLLEMMAKVVGICDCTVRARKESTGCAQRLIKNVGTEYWGQVEIDTVNLYKWLVGNKDRFGDNERNDIQIWTSDMWAELWNIWKPSFKRETATPDSFNFCWATCPIERMDEVYFMHNAGVMQSDKSLFFKGAYVNRNPYTVDSDVDPKRCSRAYYDHMKKVGSGSVLNL